MGARRSDRIRFTVGRPAFAVNGSVSARTKASDMRWAGNPDADGSETQKDFYKTAAPRSAGRSFIGDIGPQSCLRRRSTTA
jgi:hypothetical protein